MPNTYLGDARAFPGRWRYSIIAFIVLVLLFGSAMMFYATHTRRYVDVDYLFLASEIAHMQRDTQRLRITSEDLMRQWGVPHQQQLMVALEQLDRRRLAIDDHLQRSRLLDAEHGYLQDELEALASRLALLTSLARSVLDEPEKREELARLSRQVGNDLVFIYRELDSIVVEAVAQLQQHIGTIRSFVIAFGALVLVIIAVLLVVIGRLLGQQVPLRRLTFTDQLTGLDNRRCLQKKTNACLALSGRRSFPVSFALIDIDHFKSINDLYGHPVGDQVLKLFADTLARQARQTDILARLGGEEFCLVLPNTDAAGAYELCIRLRVAIENMDIQLAGSSFNITASIGVTTTQGDGDSHFDVLYTRADRALYAAKKQGRNQVMASSNIVLE